MVFKSVRKNLIMLKIIFLDYLQINKYLIESILPEGAKMGKSNAILLEKLFCNKTLFILK